MKENYIYYKEFEFFGGGVNYNEELFSVFYI